jgi:hypothetical protein
MMSVSGFSESVPSLEFPERLEQGIVEQVGILDLRDVTQPGQ